MSGKKVFLFSISLAVVLLSGCGGSTSPTEEEGSGALLKGVAVDDLIVNGKVKAYDPEHPLITLAEGRTDNNDGSYTLQLDHEGVVVVEVTCDEKSQMKNPLTGETKACAEDLKLHSAAALTPEKKEVVVNISPITEFVVRQMEEKGATQESLEEAQSNIGDMFGFDPLGTSPVENMTYTKVIDAVHQLAEEENADSIVEVIEQLGEDLADGEAGDDTNLTQKLAAIMESSGVVNNLTENDGVYTPDTTTTTQDDTSSGQSTDETPADTNTTPTDIEIAKAFFKEIRTQTLQVVDYQNLGGGFLNDEADVLGEALENVSLNTKAAGKYVARLTGDIFKGISSGMTEFETYTESNKVLSYKQESPLVWHYDILEEDVSEYNGTLILSTEHPENITVANFDGVFEVQFDGTLPVEDDFFDYDYSSSGSALSSDAQKLAADVVLTKKVYGAELVLRDVTLAYADDVAIMDNVVLQAYYDQVDDTLNMNRVLLNSATLALQTKGFDLNGTLSVPEYRQNGGMQDTSFVTESFTTEIFGNVLCLGEHNERIDDIDNGSVVYTDKSGVSYTMPIDQWGGFYASLEGNIDDLEAEGGYTYFPSTQPDSDYWESYQGLEFDDLNISNSACDFTILEKMSVEVVEDKNITHIDGEVMCIKYGMTQPFTTLNVHYTDPDGRVYDKNITYESFEEKQSFTLDINGTDVFDDYNEGSAKFSSKNVAGMSVVDFDRIVTSGEYCTNLIFLNLSIKTKKSLGESYKTYIKGYAMCYDDNVSDLLDPNTTLTYIDKDGMEHPVEQWGGEIYADLDGNLEHLSLTKRTYEAAGIVNSFEKENVDIQIEGCANPSLQWFSEYLEKDESFTNSGFLPKKLLFDGMIADKQNNSILTGRLMVDWLNIESMDLSVHETPEVEVTVAGKLQMPERPELLLNLGFRNDNRKNNFSLSYQYDQTVVTATGIFDEALKNGTIEMGTHTGLKVVISVQNGEVVYGAQTNVTRNGTLLGTLEERDGIPVVKYIDGSFESLQ